MESIMVDFSKGYIGTIAKQGEHNKSQLVFSLPDTFADADYVNAEFEKSNNSIVIIERLTPENGTVTIPLTQELTDVGDRIDVQLVAYIVDGGEINEIAKSLTVRGVIRKSLNAAYNADRPGVIERIIAFIQEWAQKYPIMWDEKHTHNNKTALDEITADNVASFSDVAANTSARHTHVNKDILDSITYEDLSRIHVHDNKSVLDTITANDVNVRSDWNENDPTSKNFIKNRTHWVATEEVTKSYTVEWTGTPPETQFQPWAADELGIVLVEGEEYSLRVGNQTFVGVCEKSSATVGTQEQDYYYIGNPHLYDQTREDNHFPMLLVYDVVHMQSSDWTLNVLLTDESLFGSDLTFSLGQEETVYHKLSESFFPDSVNDAVDKKHTHSNKNVLDSVTTQMLTDIVSNTSARHTHSNKSTLDTITAQNVTDIKNLHNNALLLQLLSSTSFASGGTNSTLCYFNIPVDGVKKATISSNGYTGVLKAGAIFYFSTVQTGDNDNAITITGFENNAGYQYPEYAMDFTTGSTAPTLTLPIEGVSWVDEPILEANKHYQISIVNGIGLWCSVDVEEASS